jgi:hypothetical protein
VAQRETVRSQLVLQHRAQGAGLDARGTRAAVELEHAIEPREVDRHHSGVTVADVALDAAYNRRTAAVGDGGDAFVRAPIE